MPSHPQSILDPLCCEEDCYLDTLSDHKPSVESLLGQDLLQDEELRLLLRKEQENELSNGFEESPFCSESRTEAVEWMLRVIVHYSFSALTALLAVNYLDRFCQTLKSHKGKPWMCQLAAVGCLSLAAKVEETQVPLLLDLQVEASKYVFESKTIQRMEVLILSSLKWKMNPVTTLSFLDHISRALGLMSGEFLRRSHCVMLSVVSDSRFMCCLPSAMATATMVYVICSLEPCMGVEHQDQLYNILGTNKDKVQECCRLIQEVTTIDDFRSGKRKFGSFLDSPRGVIDVCFTSDDDSNESWAASSSPEPFSKKIKSWAANDETM